MCMLTYIHTYVHCVLECCTVALATSHGGYFVFMLTEPTEAVSGVSVSRVDNTSMQVSWTELTLRQARGFPVYTVLYERSTGPVGRVSRQAASMPGVIRSPVTVEGLDPDSEYTVEVRVDTNETAASGGGPVSESGQSPIVC